MKNIELVIKISEKTYNALTHAEFDANLIVDKMRKAIANGTPLPKGHGDLKDMNDLCNRSRCGCNGNCDYVHTCNLYSAPTIIEADRSEEE